MADESKIPEVAEVVTAVVVAGATAGVALTALPAAGLAFVPAIVGGVAKGAMAAYGRAQQRKAERWFQLVADLLQVAPEEAAKAIEENIEEPWAHEAVVEGVRGILNGIDDVALPALAKIVARRLKSKTPPDRKDKRAIQLLCELEAETHDALRNVIAICTRFGVPPEVRLSVDQDGRLDVRDDADAYNASVLTSMPPPSGWRRAFVVLKRHEFGHDTPIGTIAIPPGPRGVDLSFEDVEYLSDVLG